MAMTSRRLMRPGNFCVARAIFEAYALISIGSKRWCQILKLSTVSAHRMSLNAFASLSQIMYFGVRKVFCLKVAGSRMFARAATCLKPGLPRSHGILGRTGLWCAPVNAIQPANESIRTYLAHPARGPRGFLGPCRHILSRWKFSPPTPGRSKHNS